jgi:Glu-tRNA(Gln) amidotransferase subunit E-like FAD-binding protein
MSKRDELLALQKGLAQSVLSTPDEQLLEEVKEEGLDPTVVAEETRALLMNTVKRFRQRALVAAKEEHRQKATQIAARRFRLPVTAAEKRQLLDAVIAQHQQEGRMLTAQHRDFTEMTDDDVESLLQQFGALGLLGAEAESEE